MKKINTVLNLNHNQAQEFFLRKENYSDLDMPIYFDFQKILDEARKLLDVYKINDLYTKNLKPHDFENVNYPIFINKNAKHSWRKIELIHPILYVNLVKIICDEKNWNTIKDLFNKFSKNKNIKCCSIPVNPNKKRDTVLNCWSEFEQNSIFKSIKYNFMGITDIKNCYPSIYTHTIAWAIHGKEWAKKHRKEKDGLGNLIDKCIQEMNCGQTNGIPQGSTISNLIAEIVLGYADECLVRKLSSKNIDYEILRYRDDYRIFANDEMTVKTIIKELGIVLSDLNLNINDEKTQITDSIISNSIKPDKKYRILHPCTTQPSLQKSLLSTLFLSEKFPNSGSVLTNLIQINKTQISKLKKTPDNYEQIVSILIDLMKSSPRTYGICAAMLSKIIFFLKPDIKKYYINCVLNKFKNELSCDYLSIWIQRITATYDLEKEYKCLLCEKLYKDNTIWNSDWLNSDFKLDESIIINKNILHRMSPIIQQNEVDCFWVNRYF